jgi:hypothetical protein
VKGNHLFLQQGMQIATSMAPLKMCCSGWMSTCRIFLTHYGFHVSSSHATPTQETDYVGVSAAAGLEPLRSVTYQVAECQRPWALYISSLLVIGVFGLDLKHTMPRECQATALALVRFPAASKTTQVQNPF